MTSRFTRISMVEYENQEAMRLSLRQYEDELAPKIMEYAKGCCQNKQPCQKFTLHLATQLCPILYPSAISKPVQRSSNLR